MDGITLHETHQDLRSWLGEDVSAYIRIPHGTVAKLWGPLGVLPDPPGRPAGQSSVRYTVGPGAVVEIGGATFESAKRHRSGGLLLRYRLGTTVWIQRRLGRAAAAAPPGPGR